MKTILKTLAAGLVGVAVGAALAVSGQQTGTFSYGTTAIYNTKELRYMGSPHPSVIYGGFQPNPTVQAAFIANHPCPSNPAATDVSQCFGWEPVHVIAIACGGNDSVFNLMWMPHDMAERKRAYEVGVDGRAPVAMPYTNCPRAVQP